MSVKDLQAVVAEPVSLERSCKAPYQVWLSLDGKASLDSQTQSLDSAGDGRDGWKRGDDYQVAEGSKDNH
jgi:hypothetical protein